MKTPRAGFYSALRWITTPAHLLPLLVAVLLTTLLLLAIHVLRAEPRYQGHSLKWWLQEVVHTSSSSDTYDTYVAKREASRKAIQAMGTNAIPHLVSWLQAPAGSPLKAAYNRLLSRQRIYPVQIPKGEDSDAQIHSLANRGFALLGKDALFAIPALAEIAKSNDASTRRRTYAQLSRLVESFHPDREALLSVFTPLLTNGNERVSVDAAIFLYEQFPETAEKLGIHRENSRTALTLGIERELYKYTFYYLSPGWHTSGITNAHSALLDGASNGMENLKQ
jgi:hypothetical protein